MAVGAAIADGHRHDDLETCVSVARPTPTYDADEAQVIPSCGTRRGLLADYDEDLRVVVPGDGEERAAWAIDLLPTRTW